MVQSCTLCGAALVPGWQHAAWECPSFASSRPWDPGDAWSRRLGWPMVAETTDQARLRLQHLEIVRKALRDQFGFQRDQKRRREDQ